MNLSANLRSLRQNRGLTQTEVAEAINLSPQAVSKWENDSGLPDISQLIPLADFFGVTVDELLGHDLHAADREIDEFIRTHGGAPNSETWRSFLAETRAMVAKYPANEKLRMQLCYALFICPKEGGFDGKDEAHILYSELTDIAEELLAKSTDAEIRNKAVFYLMATYPYQNRYEKVKALAETVPDMYTCREAILTSAAPYGSTEHWRYEEDLLQRSMMNVIYEPHPWRSPKFNPDAGESLALCEMQLNLMRAYFTEEDYDSWTACNLFEIYVDAAKLSLILYSTAESAIRYLTDGIAMLEKVKANDSTTYTSVFMKHLTKPRVTWDDGYAKWAINTFRKTESEEFAALHGIPEYTALKERFNKLIEN